MTQEKKRKAIQTAILYATGFRIYGHQDQIYDNTNVNFEHTQVEAIKAVDKGEYEMIDKDCARVLNCVVYF